MRLGTCSFALISLAASPPGTETPSWCSCPLSDPRAICHALGRGCTGARGRPSPRGEKRGIARRGEGDPGNNGTPRSTSAAWPPRPYPAALLPSAGRPINNHSGSGETPRLRGPAPPRHPSPPTPGDSGEPGAAGEGWSAESARPPIPAPAPAGARPPAPSSPRVLPLGGGFEPGPPAPSRLAPRAASAPLGRGETPAAAAERSATLGCRELSRSPARARHLLLGLEAGVEASHGAPQLPRCPGAGMPVGQLGSQGSARTAHTRGPVH